MRPLCSSDRRRVSLVCRNRLKSGAPNQTAGGDSPRRSRWKALFHLRPLAYCEIVIFTTTSGSLPKNPPFFAPTCDPRSHDQKSPIFVSGRMGTSAQKMYPTPLVKAVMVMLLTNLVASKGKITPYAPIQSCQLLPFVLLLFIPFGSTIFLTYPGLVLDSPLFAELTLLKVSCGCWRASSHPLAFNSWSLFWLSLRFLGEVLFPRHALSSPPFRPIVWRLLLWQFVAQPDTFYLNYSHSHLLLHEGTILQGNDHFLSINLMSRAW